MNAFPPSSLVSSPALNDLQIKRYSVIVGLVQVATIKAGYKMFMPKVLEQISTSSFIRHFPIVNGSAVLRRHDSQNEGKPFLRFYWYAQEKTLFITFEDRDDFEVHKLS